MSTVKIIKTRTNMHLQSSIIQAIWRGEAKRTLINVQKNFVKKIKFELNIKYTPKKVKSINGFLIY